MLFDIVSDCSVHTKQSERTRYDMSFHLPTSVSPTPSTPLTMSPMLPTLQASTVSVCIEQLHPSLQSSPSTDKSVSSSVPSCPSPTWIEVPSVRLVLLWQTPHRVPQLVSRAPLLVLVCVNLDDQSSARHPAVYPSVGIVGGGGGWTLQVFFQPPTCFSIFTLGGQANPPLPRPHQ